MFKSVEKVSRIDNLIRLKATGSPSELASKLGMSERMVYYYLELMRDMGGPIKYDKIRKTYYYENKTKFVTGFMKT